MVGVLFKSYDIEIETLAPVHISSGETLIPNLDYFIDKNELYYLDKEKYLSSLSEDDLKSIFNSILCSSEAIGDQKDNMINAKKFSVKFNANINFGSSKYIYETVKIDGTPYIPGSSLKGAFINGFYYSDNNNSYKPSSNSADHIDFNHNFGFSDAYILHTNDNPLAVYDLYYFSLWSKKGQPLATEFIDKGIKFKTFFLLNKDFSLLSLKQRFKNLNDYSLSIIEREKKWWLKFSEIVTNQGNNYQNNKIHFENLHATVMSQYGELENKIKELQKY
ncbi:MAG: type III-A CRISPR-associated RAMP protein Csm5, partial [Candidatus Aenigmatarchaeota archaeon]